MRKIFYFLLIPALFACEEKSLVEEDKVPDPNNISIQTSFVYDTLGLRLDSIYTNNLGQEFFFEEVQLVFSNYIFVESGDTVVSLPEPFLMDLKEPVKLIGVITPGGYSGKYGLQLGLDTTQGFGYNSSLAKDEDLKNSSVFRKDGWGIDQVIMKGKLFDPADPLDSIGKIPFEYRLGTPITVQNYNSDVQNFSVSSSSKIPFILQVNLWPIFKNLDIKEMPLIESDPDNVFDMKEAEMMADSLIISLF